MFRLEEELGLLTSKSHFDKEAELVRRGFEGFVGLFQKRWIGRIARRLHVARGMLILDIGCGTAHHLSEFVELGMTGIGCDFSSGMLRQARRVIERKRARIELVLADSRSLPFRGEAFDIVFSNAVLHHIPSRQFQHTSILEMVRVLRDGGRILVSVANASNLAYRFVRRVSKGIFRDKEEDNGVYGDGPWFRSRTYGWVYIGKMVSTELVKWLEDAGIRIRHVRYVGPNLPPIGARARMRFHKVLDLFYYAGYDMMDILPDISLLRLCSTDFYIIGHRPISVQELVQVADLLKTDREFFIPKTQTKIQRTLTEA